MGYSAIVLPQLKPYMDGGHELYPHYRPFVINDEQGSWVGKSTRVDFYRVTMVVSYYILLTLFFKLNNAAQLLCNI